MQPINSRAKRTYIALAKDDYTLLTVHWQQHYLVANLRLILYNSNLGQPPLHSRVHNKNAIQAMEFQLVFLKFEHSEKDTKFEKIFHLKFDVTQQCQILSGRFFFKFVFFSECPNFTIGYYPCYLTFLLFCIVAKQRTRPRIEVSQSEITFI